MLQLERITKEYATGGGAVVALRGVTVDFRESELVAVLGPSGCGKTTLLNIVGGLDRFTDGDLFIDGISTRDYSDRDWDAYRNHRVGFVFQNYNLIPHQDALSNVEMALKISGMRGSERRERARAALEAVGLADQVHKKPSMMSGGQMQRVAIARALVNDPDIILADEPTGALDSETSVQVMEILKDVAADRLVIMVTHNPELAERYATRIVQLKDGAVVSDSNPPAHAEAAASATAGGKASKLRSRLSFATSVGLSAKNLLTKKGRTLLTAFAGAIGIIGIALILALSNGVNDYIDSIERDTMGSYPIELEQETFDMAGMMGDAPESPLGQGDGDEAREAGVFYSSNVVADMVKSAESMRAENDLGAFKLYLDTNGEDLDGSLSAVEYTYDLAPQVYRMADDGEPVKASPVDLLEDEDAGAAGMSSFFGSSSSTAWAQLPETEQLRASHYELLAGSWPVTAGEAALVVNGSNQVSDAVLYTIGLMDAGRMDGLVEAVRNGDDYDDPVETFSFDDALGLSFKAIAPCDLYEKTEEGVWVDRSDDGDFIAAACEGGRDVEIVAVLRAGDDAELSNGVAYTAALTYELMDHVAESEIAHDQLADPEVNVLTGEAFEEDDEDAADRGTESEADGGDAGSGDAASLASLSSRTRMADPVQEVAPQAVTAVHRSQAPGASTLHLAEATAAVPSSPSVSSSSSATAAAEESEEADGDESETHRIVFLDHDKKTIRDDIAIAAGAEVEAPDVAGEWTDAAYSYSFIGWKDTSTGIVYTDKLPAATADATYLAYYYQTPLPASGSDMDLSNLTLDDLAKMGVDVGSLASGMDTSNLTAGDLSAMGVDTSAFLSGDAAGLSDSQLTVLLAQMSSDTPSTYEDVLAAIGYVTRAEPSGIKLYPVDFDAKKRIKDFIASYNDQAETDAQKVTYTDMIGVMVSSVTQIVNTISYVLVAFVAISLIVSSIMIAIITYISVLERTKEIGVLRAIGASKGDVTKIFTAETFIEGLLSGLVGVGAALALCVPVNAVVGDMFGFDGIATLPLQYGAALVGVSIVLTLLAGFIPSRMAARKDPAVSLRSL